MRFCVTYINEKKLIKNTYRSPFLEVNEIKAICPFVRAGMGKMKKEINA